MSIEIIHHGAHEGVTGSCHELRVGEAGLLVDCGLFQGEDAFEGGGERDPEIEFPVSDLRALVVSHVHIDHVGRIPYLLAAGFTGPILCSQPSARMLPVMLEDALRVGFTRDREMIERFLDLLCERIVAVPYGEWHPVFEDGDSSLSIRLQRAGHILGSAYVECDAVCGEERERIVFSGDLGAPDTPLLPAPTSPEYCDRLVLESTYGDRLHEGRAERHTRLREVIEHALRDGGTVVVPAFSLGRTQELLYELEGLIHDHGDEAVADGLCWRDLEIVVDSPLAQELTELYRELKPFWDEEAHERLSSGRRPLAFPQRTLIERHEDHQQAVKYLARTGRPCVVLAGAGMCTGGRVVNYLKAMLGQAHNAVLFVGYQAAGTPGRAILEAGLERETRGSSDQAEVELDGEAYAVRARVFRISGYSAHADQADLVRFVAEIPQRPREVRLVHGDPEVKQVLQAVLEKQLGVMVCGPRAKTPTP